MITTSIRIMSGCTYLGTLAAGFGAVTHEQVLMWSGIGTSVIAALSVAIANAYSRMQEAQRVAYHLRRETERQENRADRKADIEEIQAMSRCVFEFEQRFKAIESRADEVAGVLRDIAEKEHEITQGFENLKCRYPVAGRARCNGDGPSPARPGDDLKAVERSTALATGAPGR